MKKLKIFIITFLFFSFYAQCLLGHPRTHIRVDNNRSETITATFKTRSTDHEVTYEVRANTSRHIEGDVGLIKPATKVYEYVIIKDSNNNELMNLRGEELNNAVTIEKDNKNHVIYRLEVN